MPKSNFLKTQLARPKLVVILGVFFIFTLVFLLYSYYWNKFMNVAFPPESVSIGTSKTQVIGEGSDSLISLTNASSETLDVPTIPAGAPYKGNQGAQIKIIEFVDITSGVNQEINDTLNKILEDFPDKVKIIWRDYPLVYLNPEAQEAHQAARCAQDQGKFWAMHDLIIGNQNSLNKESYLKWADSLSLDKKIFENCLDTDKNLALIEADIEEAKKLETESSPHFWINEFEIPGAVSYTYFRNIISKMLDK